MGETDFSCWELIFAFSGSRLLFGILTLSFFEYKQSNTGEQHALNEWSTFRRSFSLKLLTIKYLYLQCTNSGVPDQLQFHCFISKCFGSNFVLFLTERDGFSKWTPT